VAQIAAEFGVTRSTIYRHLAAATAHTTCCARPSVRAGRRALCAGRKPGAASPERSLAR
jgi:predicted transcriptional regulator